MFGSLRIHRTRLSDAERELYRGHFCGSCHAMREFSGRWTSLLTNYDQTVLALVLGGLEGSKTTFRPCTAVPFRRVPVSELSESGRHYIAALNLALVEAKLIDDVTDDDSRLVRRASLRLLRGRARTAYQVLDDLGFPVAEIATLPARQAEAEELEQPSLDDLGAPSAQLTASLFAFAGEVTGRQEHRGALSRFGAALGSFVYLWDAWIDRDDDRRRQRFNAIDAALGQDAGRAVVTLHLRRYLQRLEAALAELPLGEHGAVVGHLLASMQTRVAHQVAPRSAEAGDCDCACDACSCGDCGSCGDSSDCGGGTGFAACCCCDACDACLCWSTRARERRKKRRAHKRPLVHE